MATKPKTTQSSVAEAPRPKQRSKAVRLCVVACGDFALDTLLPKEQARAVADFIEELTEHRLCPTVRPVEIDFDMPDDGTLSAFVTAK